MHRIYYPKPKNPDQYFKVCADLVLIDINNIFILWLGKDFQDKFVKCVQNAIFNLAIADMVIFKKADLICVELSYKKTHSSRMSTDRCCGLQSGEGRGVGYTLYHTPGQTWY